MHYFAYDGKAKNNICKKAVLPFCVTVVWRFVLPSPVCLQQHHLCPPIAGTMNGSTHFSENQTFVAVHGCTASPSVPVCERETEQLGG